MFWTPDDALDHDCSVVEPVERSVATPAVLEAAMRNLLAGPTDDEEAAGLTSWFSDEAAGMLRSVDVADGVARVDFDDFSTVIPNASTSCGSQMLLAQLGSTATQFDGIDEAVYSFDGDVEAFYEWLQLVPPQT
jgi:spore germination protein GerM